MALKLFARKEVEKLQLEEWKANLLQNLISKITQIHKVNNKAIKVSDF